jgi:Ca-activated chloride channel family protein
MKRVLLLLLALALLGACSRNTSSQTRIHLDDPGRCTPVDVAAAPDIAPTLAELASAFNGSRQARFGPKECAFVRVHPVESSVAAQDVSAGWPDPDHTGPPPALWVPASSAWSALANERLAARRQAASTGNGESFARTPLVIAMPAPMAHALGWPATPIGWSDLAQLAANPRGWAAHGHPEWGAFKLGKASPLHATSGLLATIAVSRLGNAAAARALESSVVSYGDEAWPFLDNWMRLDHTKRSPMSYVSAVVTDARSVAAYNAGSANGIPPDTANATSLHTQLVSIAPRDVGGMESDYPLLPVHAAWVDPATRPGVDAFVGFARGADAQAKVVKASFRAGTSSDELALPAHGTVTGTLNAWQSIRKRARVLLLFDVSDSMGDPSDPRDTNSPSKIELAKHDLLNALSELAPDDEVGLRIFTTGLSGPSPDWADVVPMGRLDHQRPALTRAIRSLTPRKGSPLYTAMHDAYDAIVQKYDPKRINGVVLLTDGYNEDEKNTDLTALLKHVHDPTRIYTIAYSPAADTATVRRIAQATNARYYDATDTSQLAPLYISALSNF